MPPEWIGSSAQTQRASFPLLVKFIFAEEKLSVQVHPDDAYASVHEQEAGGCGKTEMWYALRAAPDAGVLVGLKPGVAPEQFKSAISDGTAEELLAWIPVAAGEAIFVPAGTVHTIGPGLVPAKSSSSPTLTYRVYMITIAVMRTARLATCTSKKPSKL